MQNSCLKTSAWWSRSSHFVENGYPSLRFPNMVKVNIYEHWTRVTRFNPLWVSVNMQECLIFKKGWEPVTQGTGELLKLLSPHFSKGGPEWVFNRLVCLAHLFLMLLFVLNFAIFAISIGENDKRSLNFAKEFSTSFYFQKNEVWTTTFLNKLEQVKIRYILS